MPFSRSSCNLPSLPYNSPSFPLFVLSLLKLFFFSVDSPSSYFSSRLVVFIFLFHSFPLLNCPLSHPKPSLLALSSILPPENCQSFSSSLVLIRFLLSSFLLARMHARRFPSGRLFPHHQLHPLKHVPFPQFIQCMHWLLPAFAASDTTAMEGTKGA